MEAGAIAGIGVGGTFGLLALLKLIKRLMGFKSCKLKSDSNEEECIWSCVARKKGKKEEKKPEELNVTL